MPPIYQMSKLHKAPGMSSHKLESDLLDRPNTKLLMLGMHSLYFVPFCNLISPSWLVALTNFEVVIPMVVTRPSPPLELWLHMSNC